jgi:hypothetical protein
VSAAFRWFRAVHLASTSVVAVLAIVHSGLTARLYSSWSPDAVWFLGTGLGLLLLAVLNWTHIGSEPCERPSAWVVRWANAGFAVFGLAAVAAVPVPQAYAIALGLVGQVVAGRWTLPRAPPPPRSALSCNAGERVRPIRALRVCLDWGARS